jgi:hypothetical protein
VMSVLAFMAFELHQLVVIPKRVPLKPHMLRPRLWQLHTGMALVHMVRGRLECRSHSRS